VQEYEFQLTEASPAWFDEFIQSAAGVNAHGAGLDHWQSYGDIAVFSPYSADGAELLRLLEACSRAGLRTHLSGRSTYDPKTFRIAIYRTQDETEFHEFQEVESERLLKN
jgi:hypothetical protein